MNRSGTCKKCGATFSYDPWVDDHDVCRKCLQPVVSDASPNQGATHATPRAHPASAPTSPSPMQPAGGATDTPASNGAAQEESQSFFHEAGTYLGDALKGVAGEKYIDKSRDIIDEFRQADFKSEILSHDRESARAMLHNSTFWIATFMGVLPLLVLAFSNGENTLYGLLFFFAVMWAGIFKGFVLSSVAPIRLPVAAFFFTGIIGIGGLLAYHEYLPDFYLNMPESSSHVMSLVGSVFNTGVNEEICKLIPVLLYIAFKRGRWSVEEALLIGVFSGLGFAAFENIHYSIRFARNSASGVYDAVYRDTAALRAYSSTISSMTYIMIRSLSCLFGHAVYTGIATCFVITGVMIKKGRIVKFVLAILIPATIHGAYNWCAGRFSLGSTLANGVGFSLFFGYLLRTRRMMIEVNQDDPYVEEVEGEE